jgi:Kef-type K+ transport system membrane component KefB
MTPTTRSRRRPSWALLLLLAPAAAWASGGEALPGALLALTLVLFLAKLGGDLAVRLKQPSVLGELVAGVLLGNLDLLGFGAVEPLAHDPFVATLAELGVVLLLFEVGLESTIAQMARVGASSLLVAILGVVAPMVLGFGVGAALLPDASWLVHLFLGATLSATSVGITARVLRDLGESDSREARILLGAAVIDDVLGLIVLAAVAAMIEAADSGAGFALGPVAWLAGKAVLFLGAAIALGAWLTPFLYRAAAHLRGGGVLLGFSLAFCFGLSWLASLVNLAPIVGAFAAGLILESAHYRPFVARGDRPLEELVHPVVAFLGPVFFVRMGMQVDLATFTDPTALTIAAALVVAAVLGKQVCSLGVLEPGLRRLAIGVGMIPRGEVGLIFANMGLALKLGGQPVLTPPLFSAIVMMVIATTLTTPPLLGWALRRGAPPTTPTPAT